MAKFLILLLSLMGMSQGLAAEGSSSTFTLQSSAFEDRKIIPPLYSCDGKDISPPLAWAEAPAKTKAFALICHDPDAPAGTWYHWVLYNIPATVKEMAEGAPAPTGAVLGKNSWDKEQYNGPCPPASTLHSYVFTIYALDKELPLPAGTDALKLQKAMQGHVLNKASLTGYFGH